MSKNQALIVFALLLSIIYFIDMILMFSHYKQDQHFPKQFYDMDSFIIPLVLLVHFLSLISESSILFIPKRSIIIITIFLLGLEIFIAPMLLVGLVPIIILNLIIFIALSKELSLKR